MKLGFTSEAKAVKVKARCCKDAPRCKKCPVVLKRLGNAGLAERVDKRTWLLHADVPKKAIKAARGAQ